MTESNTSSYMADIEREKVISFMNDDIMREAVRKVMFKGIYSNGVMEAGKKYEARKNWALSLHDKDNPMQTNEQLGADLRAYSWATNMVEEAFMNMEKDFKQEIPPPTEKKNPAI